ncbi:MAG: DNA cytosine methyltransferase [Planctomycetes bacterium]|nr:DNA cytosine methyltransferase [Planctomycetota bacterium]
MASFFQHIPPGGNWRNLPQNLQELALGKSYYAGGGKTGFFRRLSWNEPAPTITGRANRKGSAICHPDFVRPLSVRECARIQGFPDAWKFVGSMSSQYQQVGNAVPVHLGAAIGKALIHHLQKSEHKPSISWDEQLSTAVKTLRASARNKKSKNSQINKTQLSVFDSKYE